MNNKEKKLYDKLLSEKIQIENNFRINSEYNRIQKHNKSIMYDPAGPMDLSNAAVTRHNNKVRFNLPDKYEELFIQYRFIY